MSRDMAQRTTPVMIERAQYTATWEDETHALIDSRRWEIVGDCLALLRPDARPLSRYSRWGAWEAGVLSRVDDPAEAQKVIAERQADVDEDAGEAATVRDGFRAELLRRGHRPDAEAVRIPAAVAAAVVNAAMRECYPVTRASVYLGTLAIPELRKSDPKGARGWAWR